MLLAGTVSQLVAQGPVLPPQDKTAVEIFLTASGKHSAPATLDQPQLTVTLDKLPAQVTSVRSAKNDKLLFALLVDVSTSNRKDSVSIRKTASQLFQDLSTGESRGYLVVFDVSASMSKRPLQPSEARNVLEGLQFGGGTALFDAIAKTCTTVLSKSGNPDTPRRVILLLSDGDDNQSHTSPQEAVQAAEREGVSVFSLNTMGPAGVGEHILAEITARTGGQAIISEKAEKGEMALLAAIDSQWVLSLVSPPNSNQKLHSFAVKSSQKGIQISAPEQIALP